MPYRPGPTRGPAQPVPAEFVETMCTSRVWPSPIVEPLTGEVANWDKPDSETIYKCGYLQVWINGVDVTWLEAGAGGPATPTQVISWEEAEPFGSAICVINFPTIYSWDALPGWLVDGCDVDLVWSGAPDLMDPVLFEGFFSSEDTNIPGPATLTIHCLGALYELDTHVEAPSTLSRLRDVGKIIRDMAIDSRRNLRITPPPAADLGVETVRSGTFDTGLTGAIADLLITANSTAAALTNPWTVMRERDRKMVIKHKRMPKAGAQWSMAAGAPGLEANLTRDILSAPTSIFAEGVAPDGCRWRNMKTPLYSGAAVLADARDTIDEARILPVATLAKAEPWTYAPDGAITGTNGTFDPDLMQVEKFVSAGERMPLADFKLAAAADLAAGWPAKYRGTITLTDDPEEGHRRFIRAGDNIKLKYFRGEADGRIFHIARVEVSHQDGTVTLTVDEQARDITVVDALIARVKDANDATKRGLRNGRTSQAVEDRYIPWDCEAGSGVLKPTALYANQWKVVRVGAAEWGKVVRTDFTCTVATVFAMAVFGYPVTTASLQAAGIPWDVPGYWTDGFTAERTKDPQISWGGQLPDGTVERAGFYPGLEVDGASITGRFVEDSEWFFRSTKPPWLWVAIIAEDSCSIHGGSLADGYRAFRVGVE